VVKVVDLSSQGNLPRVIASMSSRRLILLVVCVSKFV